MSTTVLVVSDLHVGSEQGLCPDSVKISAGSNRYTFECNSVQQLIFEKWCKMCDVVKPDIVVVNGDMCEGVNYKEHGIGNWTNDKAQQIQTCAELLEMIDCCKYVGLQGSGYHTGNNLSMDEIVMKQIGGDFGTEKFINVEDVRFHVRHETSFSKRPQRQAVGMIDDMTGIDYDRETFGDIDITIRSHLHRFSFIGWNGALGIVTPAWKWRDPFVKARNVISNDLGFITFEVSDDVYTWNPYLFKVPKQLAIDEYNYETERPKASSVF